MAWSATTPTTKRKEGMIISIPVAASQVINQGDIVIVKVGDGYAYKNYITGAAGNYFAGIAAETVDMTEINPETGSAYASAEKYIKVWQEGIFYFSKASAAKEDLLSPAYTVVADSKSAQTIAITSGGTKCMRIGTVVEYVDSATLGVKICVDGAVTS